MTYRSFFSCIILVLIPVVSFCQYKTIFWKAYSEKINTADSLYNQGLYMASAKAYSEAFSLNNQKFALGQRYNAARAWAMAGQKDSAFANLLTEVEIGRYAEYKKLLHEKAFTYMYAFPDWKKIKTRVSDNKKEEDKKLGPYKKIKPQLENIFMLDQKYRADYLTQWKKNGFISKEMKLLARKVRKQDRRNLANVSRIIDKHGWIGYDTIGFKANQALFLVIQHSNSAVQEKYLPVLEQAVKQKKAMGQDLALLTDRVYIKRGQKQVYGSQIQCDSTGKNCKIFPIEDEINVDKRRAEVGLQPLAEYVRIWGIVYKKPE